MSSTTLKIVLIGVFAAVLVGGWVVHKPVAQVANYEALLQDQIVPKVLVDGEEYSFALIQANSELTTHEKTAFYQAQYYALAARVDPQFALVGTDVAKYQAAVNFLEASEERLADQYEPAAALLVRENLYPIDFLRQLGELEVARQRVIAEPSAATVEAHYERMQEVVAVHGEYIDTIIAILEAEAANLDNDLVGFYSGLSDVPYLIAVYTELQNQADVQLAAATKRYECFQGTVDACTPIEIASVPIRSGIPRSDVGELPTDLISNYELLHTLRESPYQGEHRELGVAVLAESQCFTKYTPVYYRLWWRDLGEERKMFHPEIINEIALHDMTTGQESWQSYVDAFLETGGGPHLLQVTATHYVCPNLSVDLSRLQSMLAVYDDAVLPQYDGQDENLVQLVSKIQTAHIALTDSAVLTEANLYQYLDTVSTLFTSYTPQQLADALGEGAVLELEGFLTGTSIGAYNTDELLTAAVINNDAIIKYDYYGVAYPLDQLFFVRSMPQLLLMAFNKSVNKSDISIVKTSAPGLPDRLTTYAEIRDGLIGVDLVSELQRSIQAEITLGEAAGLEYATLE